MTKIIAFADARYLPVALNWLSALKALNLAGQARLVTLDEETRQALPPENVMHRPLTLRHDLGALWTHRIAVFKELLDANDDFIHSDADAIWLQDPHLHIERCEAEIVFSQGTIWPPDVHSLHRLVLCCGFFYLAATTRTKAFVDAVALRMETDRDDQIAVNRIIAEGIDAWKIDEPYEIPFRDTSFLASQTAIRSVPKPDRLDMPAVCVLPHHAFPRLVTNIDETVVVAHPLSGKTCAEKSRSLSSLGLWNQTS